MSNAVITKKALAQAMKELMAERSLTKINVGDVVERCGLNRNTFYYHFRDKFDLVNWIFYTELAEWFSRDEVTSVSAWEIIERLCVFFYRDREFYTSALSVSGQNSFEEYFVEVTKSLVVARMADMFAEEEHQDFYVSFFVDAFTPTILRWLRDGAQMPPEVIARLIHKAATGAAFRILQEEQPKWEEGVSKQP